MAAKKAEYEVWRVIFTKVEYRDAEVLLVDTDCRRWVPKMLEDEE